MSGEHKSAKDKVFELEKELDEYEVKLGLPSRFNRTCDHLTMTNDDAERLIPDQANEIACDLSSYAIHIQREINKHTSRISVADANIKRIVAEECNNVRAPSYEERKNIIIATNEVAQEYEKIRLKSQLIIDRLSYLPTRISYLADKLSETANGKRRSKNG